MKHLMLYEDWCSQGQLITTEPPINEDLISDIAHLVGDVAAAVADVTVPGSGAVIDVINMLSYFAEAHFSSDSLEKTKLIISGLIQAFAIFDPINAITVGLKNSLNRIIMAFGPRGAVTIAAARAAARQVTDGLTILLNGLVGISSRLSTALSGSKFAQAVKWLADKLGITSVINWIKTFITQTAVPFIKTFLTRVRDTFNPSQAGASTAADELNSVIARNIAKVTINQLGAEAIHAKVDKFANEWYANSSKRFIPADPRIVQRDATYVAPKPYFNKPI
jgi:hypothetical protein